jgi:hypothetical protein
VVLNTAMRVEFVIPAMVKLIHGHHRMLIDWLSVSLMAVNRFGVIAELIYMAIFLRFTADNQCLSVITLLVVVIISGIVLPLLLLHGIGTDFCGLLHHAFF